MDEALFRRMEQQLALARRAQMDVAKRAEKLEAELASSRAEEARLRDELSRLRTDLETTRADVRRIARPQGPRA